MMRTLRKRCWKRIEAWPFIIWIHLYGVIGSWSATRRDIWLCVRDVIIVLHCPIVPVLSRDVFSFFVQMVVPSHSDPYQMRCPTQGWLMMECAECIQIWRFACCRMRRGTDGHFHFVTDPTTAFTSSSG